MVSIYDRLGAEEVVVWQAHTRWAAYAYPLLVLLFALWPGTLTGLISTELGLTNKRLVGKYGMFRTKTLLLPFRQVDLVRVQQGLLGKAFDYGTVIIIAEDGKRMKFRGIAEPYEFKDEAEGAVEMAVLGRRLSDFEEEEEAAVQAPEPVQRPAAVTPTQW